MWRGPSTEFWKDQTIASKVVEVKDDDEWVDGFGWFPCQNNHPMICALDFGLSFLADMNVSIFHKNMYEYSIENKIEFFKDS